MSDAGRLTARGGRKRERRPAEVPDTVQLFVVDAEPFRLRIGLANPELGGHRRQQPANGVVPEWDHWLAMEFVTKQ